MKIATSSGPAMARFALTLEGFSYLQLLVQAIESDGTTMSSAWITFALGFACGAIVSPIVLFSWMIHEDKKLQAKWSRDL